MPGYTLELAKAAYARPSVTPTTPAALIYRRAAGAARLPLRAYQRRGVENLGTARRARAPGGFAGHTDVVP